MKNDCIININNKDTSLNVIYYQGFWYSYYAFLKSYDWKNEYVEKELRKHMNNIKVLSLFFDSIYIPRSHILTHVSFEHAQICINFLRSNLYDVFSKNSIIQLSIRPGLDRLSDTERIYGRIKNLEWVKILINEKNAVNFLRNTESRVIDSGKWSSNSGKNTYIFLKKAEENLNSYLGSKLTDTYKRSHSTDVPFLHEKFISELMNLDVDYNLKKEIWNVTNDIYITIPENEIKGFITYDPKNRPVSQRMVSQNYNLDMRFYYPEFLMNIIEYFIGQDSLKKLINMDPIFFVEARKIIGWRSFRNKYHEIVCELTNELISLEKIYSEKKIDEQDMIYMIDNYIRVNAIKEILPNILDSLNIFDIAFKNLTVNMNPVLLNLSTNTYYYIISRIRNYLINKILINITCPEIGKYMTKLSRLLKEY